MPFFQGASNFNIHGANMYDIGGNLYQTHNQRVQNQHTVNQQTINVGGGNSFLAYVPYMDPWTPSVQQSILARQRLIFQNVDEIPNPDVAGWFPPSSTPSQPQPPTQPDQQPPEAEIGSWQYFWIFLTDTLPRQVYLCFLLRLPSMYGSRVDQIVMSAGLSFPQLKDMALRVVATESNAIPPSNPQTNTGSLSLPATYASLKNHWEDFIDTLLEEWRTLNLVSALLVPGILTMFQITGAATGDPVTRYLAFWSLLSALVSLLYGCMFIVRFSRMRKAYSIVEWVVEVQQQLHQRRRILWNVVIMLCMPILWLTWSIVAFVVCIVWFMWRTRANLPDGFVLSAPASIDLGFRIFICAALGIGVIYGFLIFTTLQRYGIRMDEAWKQRVYELLQKHQENQPPADPGSQPTQSQPQDPSNPNMFQLPQPSPGPYQYPPPQHAAASPPNAGGLYPSFQQSSPTPTGPGFGYSYPHIRSSSDQRQPQFHSNP